MRGKIVKVDNIDRLEFLDSIGTLLLPSESSNSRRLGFYVEEGYKPDRTIITSDVEEIIVKTKNTTYTIKILGE